MDREYLYPKRIIDSKNVGKSGLLVKERKESMSLNMRFLQAVLLSFSISGRSCVAE